VPLTPAYAVSKAAAFNPTHTDVSRGFPVPKASPESVARAIFDRVEAEETINEVSRLVGRGCGACADKVGESSPSGSRKATIPKIKRGKQ
jgi:hypothetical protein